MKVEQSETLHMNKYNSSKWDSVQVFSFLLSVCASQSTCHISRWAENPI